MFNLAILQIVLPALIVYVLSAILEILLAAETVLHVQSTTVLTVDQLTSVNSVIQTINFSITPAFFAVSPIAKLAIPPITAQLVLLTIT